MTNCKACGIEIAEGIHRCPSCGKPMRRRSFFKKHKLMVVILATTVLMTVTGLVLINKDQITINPVVSKVVASIPSNTTENVIKVSKDDSRDYHTIQDAIIAAQGMGHKVSIEIYPGVYKEHLELVGKNISLIGINKDTCIIRDDSGDYTKAPLSISGDANISNLTFISSHDDGTEYAIPSYAVHCDSPGAGTTTFFNCKMVSYQNSAVGIGLQQDQTIVFDTCELRKISNYNSGSLYVHNSQFNNITNQHLIVKNCNITTDLGLAMKVDDANTYIKGTNSPMDIAFYNNNFSSDELGKVKIIWFRDTPLNGGISGQIKLAKDSSGNNIASLNAKQ